MICRDIAARCQKTLLSPMSAPSADADSEVGKKRKRVTINETANEVQSAGPAAVAAGTASRRTRRKVQSNPSGLEFDDDEDADEEDVVVSGPTSGYDDVEDDANDAGVLEEEAAGARFGEREKLDSDADGGDGAGGVKQLKHVRGERDTRPAEEFNEAGDAFEPFHLRQEREEGYFDDGGNYVWKKKDAEDNDPWLDSLDAMDPRERSKMQTAAKSYHAGAVEGDDDSSTAGAGGRRTAGGASESKRRGGGDDGSSLDSDDAGAEETPVEMVPMRKVELMLALRQRLNDGETVAAALRRLGGKAPLSAAAQAAARRKAAAASAAAGSAAASGSAPAAAEASEAPPRDMKSFNKLTEAADELLSSGETDVYGWTRKDVTWQLEDACEQAGLDVATVLRSGLAQPGAGPSSAESAAASAPAAVNDGAVGVAVPQDDGRQWEYKTVDEPGAEVFGPYSTAMLSAWRAAGYFGPERPIYLHEIVQSVGSAAAAAGASSSSAPVASSAAPVDSSASAKGAGGDDDDDDIFAGAGGYDIKAVAAAKPGAEVAAPNDAAGLPAALRDVSGGPWLRYDAAGF